MQQIDVVTTYLYGTLDTTIYMKAPPELIQRTTSHLKGENSHVTTHQAHLVGSKNISQVHKSMHEAQGPPMRMAHGYKGPDHPKMNEHMAITCGSQFATSSKGLVPNALKSKNGTAVQILRSMSGLKQSDRIWFKRFRDEMLNMGFFHDETCTLHLHKE